MPGCIGYANSSGMRPTATWRVNNNNEVPNPVTGRTQPDGGPVQWIQHKRVCPCGHDNHPPSCCTKEHIASRTCAPGCEEDLFVSGLDETMLNADMGMYRQFSVNKGFPVEGAGLCPTLKVGLVHGVRSGVEQCPLNPFADPGDRPMYQIVRDYADDGSLWLSNFFPTFEKMLKNGYTDSELTSTTPMPSLTCGRNTDNVMACTLITTMDVHGVSGV